MKRRGFTITEMLFVLGIMPVFMLISTELYRTIIKTSYATQRELSAQSAFDAASAQIWRDVFSAAEIRADDSHSILITTRSGAQIRWQSDQSNLMRIGVDRRIFTTPYDSRLNITLQNSAVKLQLVGSHGAWEEISCYSPAPFWRPS